MPWMRIDEGVPQELRRFRLSRLYDYELER